MPSSTATAARQVHVEPVMGTVVSFDVRAEAPADRAIARAVASLHEADRLFSTYREDSAIRRLDRCELPVVPGDVAYVLARCETLRQDTDGAFDVRARVVLDPSAFVKGWAAQRASDLLAAAGFADTCVSAGGDVFARGEASPGTPWTIGVGHPLDRDALAAIVRGRDLAVATSGVSERGAHITDPATRRPPGGVLQVTVTGPDLAVADAWSTAAFARGAGAPDLTVRLPRGYAAMTILADGRVLTTRGFPAAEEDR